MRSTRPVGSIVGTQFPPPDPHGPGITLETAVVRPAFARPKSSAIAALTVHAVLPIQAPEWADSDVCMRCRSDFTTLRRKVASGCMPGALGNRTR